MSAVGKNIKRWGSDIVFLLETGADAGVNLLPTLKSELFRAYNYLVSPDAGGETYTLLWNPETVRLNPVALVGNIDGYRQGWALTAQTRAGQTCNLIILHAPATASLANRQAVLDNMISESAKVLRTTLPTFLMGDLNFKSTELPTLNGVMAKYNFTFIGPSNATNNGPALTSLRKYTTLTTGGGIDPGSQPYDQFWGLNHGQMAFKTATQGVIPPDAIEKTMLGNVSASMAYLSVTPNVPGRLTRQVMQIYADDDLLLKVGQLLLLREKMQAPRLVETMDLLRIRGVDFFPIVASNDVFYNYIRTQLNQVNLALFVAGTNWKNSLRDGTPAPVAGPLLVTMPTNQYTAYLTDLTDYLFYLNLAASLFNMESNSGTLGVNMIENIVLEYAISDHYPITMIIQ